MKSVKLPWRVKSLKRLCLISVARNISYWSNDLPQDCDSALYILTPFEDLGSGLTQDVLNTLVELEQFKSSLLHLILHPSLVNLDLSPCLKLHNVGDMALKVLYKRCRKIRRLNLLGRSRLCTVNVLHGMPSAPFGHYLRELRINHDSLNDTFIQLLKEHCPGISLLHLLSCRKLTDTGFLLIGSFVHLTELYLGINHFPNFTDKILKGLLLSLNNLKNLSLSMARINLHTMAHEKPLSSLSRLHLECTSIDDISIDILTSKFPNLEDLSISHSPLVTMNSIKYLFRCTLSRLEICDTDINEYNEELQSLLKKYGLHLRFLRTFGIRALDVSAIATMCPHLESLNVGQCPNLRTRWTKPHDVMYRQHCNLSWKVADSLSVAELCYNLSSLVINCLELDDVEQGNVRIEQIIKGATQIKSLSLIGVSSLTDERISELLDIFDCTSVRHLDVSHNRNLGVAGIKSILAKCNHLETLQVTNCDLVRQEFTDLIRMIKSYKSDVVLNHLEYW